MAKVWVRTVPGWMGRISICQIIEVASCAGSTKPAQSIQERRQGCRTVARPAVPIGNSGPQVGSSQPDSLQSHLHAEVAPGHFHMGQTSAGSGGHGHSINFPGGAYSSPNILRIIYKEATKRAASIPPALEQAPHQMVITSIRSKRTALYTAQRPNGLRQRCWHGKLWSGDRRPPQPERVFEKHQLAGKPIEHETIVARSIMVSLQKPICGVYVDGASWLKMPIAPKR